MKLVIWLSVLTDHQLHTFRALQTLLPEQISYVVGTKKLAAREEQGWSEVIADDLALEILPAKHWLHSGREMLNRYPNAIHLFGGLWADRRFFPLLWLAQKRGMATALMMEPYADRAQSYFGIKPSLSDRLKAILRPVAYRLAGLLIARRFLATFPISKKAVDQLRSLGVKERSIFPFGYFVPALGGDLLQTGRQNILSVPTLRLVFVGNIIARKGLPTLLSAVNLCHGQGLNVSLDVYGPGSLSAADNLLITQGVVLRGVVPFGEAQRMIKNYDVLVLPSLHDGWGVVVNEALLQGVPVIVSDATGARCLVEKSGAGCIFKAGDVQALVMILADLAQSPQQLLQWRTAVTNFQLKLSPQVAGKYLYECLRFAVAATDIKPIAPWYA